MCLTKVSTTPVKKVWCKIFRQLTEQLCRVPQQYQIHTLCEMNCHPRKSVSLLLILVMLSFLYLGTQIVNSGLLLPTE